MAGSAVTDTHDIAPTSTSLTDPALLEKFDKLFACNVGDYVALPQLIAVGDQSSGKSSVLEGLTGLPFPRDSTLCTRFATQIVFRRAVGQASRRIQASIKPAAQSHPECVARLKSWGRTETAHLDPKAFSDMIHEVHTVMGIRSLEDQSKPTFSRHVFRLEISGPDEDHLAVIDVPGIFKSVTPGVTTKHDIDLVRSMVQEYMRNPRSIILAVLPANVDAATQEVIERAREADPEGQRTLGVLTKPDLVDRGAEHQVLDLISGKTMPLRHGWVLVRNLGKSELAIGDKTRMEVEEELRMREGWGSVPADRFGIESLRQRLQETVTENARREFPMVRLDINKKLKETKAALQALGQERLNRSQQVDFLLDLVARFQEVMSNALRGNYGADDIFDKVKRFRLATTVIDRNEQFKSDMMNLGHIYRFHTESEANPQPIQTSKAREESVDEGHITTRKIDTRIDVNDALTDPEVLSPPVDEDIYQWLESEYLGSRGFELGTFNTSLLPTVMKKQSSKWGSIAMGYISDIIAVVNAFIISVLNDLCVDGRISRGLLAIMTDELQKKYAKAIEHTRFLLDNERNDTLISLHQSFTESLQIRPEMKMQKLIADKTFHAGNAALGKVVRLEDIKSAMPGYSNRDYMVQQIHDILQAYYNVAQARFVDNVCMQSANYYLLSGPKSPMKLLSPTFVYRLSDQELEDIAGEDPVIHRQRLQLSKEIEDLEVAKKILL
ncbi:dynamin family protein [Aspergillus undulatus]|uniref:dynamin family protein n=1 Tax=Aspergillus undulatus TaxID=1810928 RepID=UPI003CCDBEDF